MFGKGGSAPNLGVGDTVNGGAYALVVDSPDLHLPSSDDDVSEANSSDFEIFQADETVRNPKKKKRKDRRGDGTAPETDPKHPADTRMLLLPSARQPVRDSENDEAAVYRAREMQKYRKLHAIVGTQRETDPRRRRFVLSCCCLCVLLVGLLVAVFFVVLSECRALDETESGSFTDTYGSVTPLTLSLSVQRGDVTVARGGAGGAVRTSFVKRARSDTDLDHLDLVHVNTSTSLLVSAHSSIGGLSSLFHCYATDVATDVPATVHLSTLKIEGDGAHAHVTDLASGRLDTVSMTTDSGGLTMRNVSARALNIHSNSGDVSLEAVSTSVVQLSTEGGNINAVSVAVATHPAKFTIQTLSGGVVLNVAGFNGSYSVTGHPVRVVPEGLPSSGTYGGGGPDSLTIDSSKGGVYLTFN